MTDIINDVACDKCVHQAVCAHKQDFLDIISAVENCTVNKPSDNGKTMSKLIGHFECLDRIVITCRYFRGMPLTRKEGVLTR